MAWLYKSTDIYPLFYYLTSALLGSLGTHLLDIKSPTKVEISDLNETQNKHVSDGLAWSYYFGYLKLILPGWDNTIQSAHAPKFTIDGEDIRDKISDNRLFIVIPKSCWCYKAFVDIDPRISFVTTMPEQRITRGGVQERVYKNSLYKVSLKGKEPAYVMLEYATPLLSMYDMSKNSEAAFTETNKDEQVVEFYSKLSEILNKDPEIRKNYQLILTDDMQDTLAETIYDSINSARVGVENNGK